MTSPQSHQRDASLQLPFIIPEECLERIVTTVLESGGLIPGWPIGHVALEEQEAARCLGIKPHVLRDARLRLRLPHTRIGRSITYSAQQVRECIKLMGINEQ